MLEYAVCRRKEDLEVPGWGEGICVHCQKPVYVAQERRLARPEGLVVRQLVTELGQDRCRSNRSLPVLR
jgi:hypothetical protein